ncbi:chemotaxis protein CheY [Pseudomonas sp. Leaf48]|uniref:chemotaxis protein CheY n=1 Tax=Pseudomonas sp. Leaf48 TaxID=1736221 RepID=UPI0009E91982|nr:chemotaxis protein CheY [Pseudomonas sp. Leaf48]
MPNHALRILIADVQHFNCMRIERLFNQLGYFAVAPVQSLEELLRLTEYGSQPFDLVLINSSMADGSLNLPDFFIDNHQVRHAFIFDGRQAQLAAVPDCIGQTVWISHAELPDLSCVQKLMAAVDPRLPFVGTVISDR